jgi:hypothetical protein
MFHPVFNFADAYKRVAQDRLDHGRRLCIDDHAGDEAEMFVRGQDDKVMFEGDRGDDKSYFPPSSWACNSSASSFCQS